MKRFNVEIGVGLFMVVGFLCFAYLAIRLGGVSVFGPDSYTLKARFSSASGLKPGAIVELAGVKIGTVTGIVLEKASYEASVDMSIQKGVQLQEDSIASIRTAGIIGDRYVNITPGGSEQLLSGGGVIRETESSINLEELVSKYIFEK